VTRLTRATALPRADDRDTIPVPSDERIAMTPSPKQQFLDVYQREHQTTLKVLRAFPADKAGFQPHERSSSALKLAWTFVVENSIITQSLRGPLQLGAGMPKSPATFAEVIAAYEASTKETISVLEQTPESRLGETVQFFAGPGKMADYPVGEFLWFMFLDSIHHRGQLSVYIRLAGGKVPSIYGPSADEPWM
jgi:uncharacterized damage-inducible protein DinB